MMSCVGKHLGENWRRNRIYTTQLHIVLRSGIMSQLADLQKAISRTRRDRGFVTDPVKIHLLLSEEIGELASEIKKLWSKNYDDFDRDRLGEEIADVLVLLSALATEFDIDMEQAVVEKFFRKDGSREWKSAIE